MRVLSLLRALSRDLDEDIDQAELRGVARNVADGAWLLLVLAGLYVLTPDSQPLRPMLAAGAIATYAVLTLALRFLPAFRRETRLKIVVQLLAMIVFTTIFLFSMATSASLLLVLYLLPVIISALTLGRWPTVAVTLLSVAGFLLAALLRHPAGLPSGREITELGIALAPFLLVAYVAALLAHEIDTAKQRIRTLSETDELTGLANLRAFSRLHRLEHERAIRHDRVYSIIVMDLDGLKQINDGFGHETGDRAIVVLANVIARLIRATDAAARFGGDEFVLLLSESDAEDAGRIALRIRSAVERCTIEVGGRMVHLSVSTGMASFPHDADDPRELVAVADQAMYRDKQARLQQCAESETRTKRLEVV